MVSFSLGVGDGFDGGVRADCLDLLGHELCRWSHAGFLWDGGGVTPLGEDEKLWGN